jgi:hypothetical protein
MDIEFRPGRSRGWLFATLFLLAAAALVWTGAVVTDDARSAMNWPEQLLFTVVPIRGFAWLGAAVFLALAVLVVVRSRRTAATLVVADATLTLPEGTVVAWRDVRSVRAVRQDRIDIGLPSGVVRTPAHRLRSLLRFWTHRPPTDQVSISAFDLGADPHVVAALLRARSTGRLPPADETTADRNGVPDSAG